MPSTYTNRLRLTLPATGELNGVWGTTVNTGVTELLDASIAGSATLSTWGGTGVAYTLSSNNGIADEARCMFLVASGSPGEAKNIICPAVTKLYILRNSVAGGFSVTLKTLNGTGVTVPNGATMILRCDGTNVTDAITRISSLTLNSALPVTSGGTGNTTGNAPTATALQTSRTLWGQSFSGAANVSGNLTSVGNITGTGAVTITATLAPLGLVATGANDVSISTNGSQRMVVDSSGAVGLGNSSPSANLHIGNALFGSQVLAFSHAGSSAATLDFRCNGAAFSNGWIQYDGATGAMRFATTGNERMRIDGSGVIRYSNQLRSTGQSANQVTASLTTGISDANFKLWVSNGTSGTASGTTMAALMLAYEGVSSSTSGLSFLRGATATDASMGLWAGNAERMRIDSSGNLLVGTTTSLGSGYRAQIIAATSGSGLIAQCATDIEAPVDLWNTATSGDNNFSRFFTEGGTGTIRGSITYNRAGGLVAYNTTSDRRAKDLLGPVENAGEIIDALQVHLGRMKGASVERPMFVADEVQAVAPYAVTGEAGAEDADGRPIYQQIDVSSLVPLLIAEVQALRQRVAALEATK